MGGAFVAVADDASAVYWNPAGLAVGSYFSLVLDGGIREPSRDRVTGRNAVILPDCGDMPPLGLSYYRMRQRVASPAVAAAADRGTGR